MNKWFNLIFVIIGLIIFFFIRQLIDGPGWWFTIYMILTAISMWLVTFGILGFFTWNSKKAKIWISMLIAIILFVINILVDFATSPSFMS